MSSLIARDQNSQHSKHHPAPTSAHWGLKFALRLAYLSQCRVGFNTIQVQWVWGETAVGNPVMYNDGEDVGSEEVWERRTDLKAESASRFQGQPGTSWGIQHLGAHLIPVIQSC